MIPVRSPIMVPVREAAKDVVTNAKVMIVAKKIFLSVMSILLDICSVLHTLVSSGMPSEIRGAHPLTYLISMVYAESQNVAILTRTCLRYRQPGKIRIFLP